MQQEQHVKVELGQEFDEFFQPSTESAPRANLTGSNGKVDLASRIQKMNPTEATPQVLYNVPKARYLRQKELPGHRLMIELLAKGLSYAEVAKITGSTHETVEDIAKQPYQQRNLVEEVRRHADLVDQQVLEIVKEGCLVAAQRLLRIVKDDKAPAMAHISAAEKFLERRYGKANQPINAGTNVDLNSLTDSDLAKMLTPTDGTGTNGS